MNRNFVYILSFIPSFVHNEITALRNAGVRTEVILLSSPYAHKAREEITTIPLNVIYLGGQCSKFFILQKFCKNFSWFLAGSNPNKFYYSLEILKALFRRQTKSFSTRGDALNAVNALRASSKLRPSRIHTHFAWHNAYVAAGVANLLDVPFSLTVHANDIYALKKEEMERQRWLFNKADKIITISQFNKNLLTKTHSDLEGFDEKVTVIHCGIPFELFESVMTPNPRGDLFRIVSLPSGFVEKKGLSVLLRAIKILREDGKEIECVVIGGETRNRRRRVYEDEAHQLGISEIVRFIGAIPQKDLRKLFRECNAFVLPCIVDSSGKMDGIPVSLMEAMAAGLIVISTKVSGIPELIEHGKTGFLARPNNAADLAAQMRTVMDSPDSVIKQVSMAAQRTIDSEFNIKVVASELIDALSLPT